MGWNDSSVISLPARGSIASTTWVSSPNAASLRFWSVATPTLLLSWRCFVSGVNYCTSRKEEYHAPPRFMGESSAAAPHAPTAGSREVSHPDSIVARMERLVQNSDTGDVKAKQNELRCILSDWLQSYHNSNDTTPTVTPEQMYLFCTQKLPFRPDLVVFEYLMDALVENSKRNTGITMSHAALGDRMLRTMVQHIRKRVADNNVVFQVFQPSLLFHKVLRLYCNERKVKQADRLLRYLEDLAEQRPRVFSASRDAYSIVLAAYARRAQPREAEKILLFNMLERRGILPTRENFESCLNAWAVSGTPNSGQRAELLLLHMQDLYERHGLAEYQPTVKLVSKATAAWVNSQHPDAMARAEAVLSTMYAVKAESMEEEGLSKTLADTHVLVAKLWSRSQHPEAPEKCRACLDLLRDKVGLHTVSPLAVQKLYAALIFAFADSGRRKVQSKVRSILVEMRSSDPPVGFIENAPNLSVTLYHALFHAYAKTADVSSAGWLLKSMIQDYRQRAQQHDVSSDPQRMPPPPPDVKSFNCVLLAWSRSTHPDAVTESLQLFDIMDRFGDDTTELPQLRKDIVTYNTLLATLGRTQSAYIASQGHDRFLELMELGLEPTRVTFVAALGVWTNIRSIAAVQRMEEIVGLLQKLEPLQLDARMYEICVRIIRESPLVGHAASRKMKALHKLLGPEESSSRPRAKKDRPQPKR